MHRLDDADPSWQRRRGEEVRIQGPARPLSELTAALQHTPVITQHRVDRPAQNNGEGARTV